MLSGFFDERGSDDSSDSDDSTCLRSSISGQKIGRHKATKTQQDLKLEAERARKLELLNGDAPAETERDGILKKLRAAEARLREDPAGMKRLRQEQDDARARKKSKGTTVWGAIHGGAKW